MNARGQALLQTVFAMAILSVVGAGAVIMIRGSQSEVAMFATKQGHLKLQQDLKMSLGRSVICRNIFHATFNPSVASNPVSIDWSSMFAMGATPTSTTLIAGVALLDYGVRVNAIEFLMNPAPVRLGRLRSGADLYQGSLLLSSESVASDRPFGNVHVGPFYFEVMGNAVLNCYGQEDIESVSLGTCEAMGGTMLSGRCDLPARLADVSCSTGYGIQSFQLSNAQQSGCVDLRP